MITDTLVIAAFTALAVLLWATLPLLVPDRDDDGSSFNWQGTVPAGPGLCSCGAPHAVSPDAPFPGDPVPLPAPVPPSRPEYVRTALDGHDDADGWVESRWRKIDGEMLAAQLGDGAP